MQPAWTPTPTGAGEPAVWRDRTFGSFRQMQLWDNFISTHAIACLGGQLSRCDSTGVTATGAPDDIASAGVMIRPQYERDLHWGSTATYLPSLVSAIGVQRFSAFWRSPLEPDAALVHTAGISLAEWTRRWAMRSHPGRPIGPAISAAELLAVALLMGLLFRVAVGISARRECR
jgi:hypothetical protein